MYWPLERYSCLSANLRRSSKAVHYEIFLYRRPCLSSAELPYRGVRSFQPMPDLSRKRERDRLPVRREPHWHRLLKGGHLGFRRGPDTWIAKLRDRLGGRHYKAIEGAGPKDFDSAKKLAEQWFVSLAAPAHRCAPQCAGP
jgi:hypothetical protein